MRETIFKPGDKVVLKQGASLTMSLDARQAYIVAAVATLAKPHYYYVNPAYWAEDKWAGLAGRTRLEVAGHSQRLFFDGILDSSGLPSDTPDPEGKNRAGFSGAWFVRV